MNQQENNPQTSRQQTTQKKQYEIFVSYSMDPDYTLSRRVESFLEGFHKLKVPDGIELKPLRVCRDGSDFSLHQINEESTNKEKSQDFVQQVLIEYLQRSEYLLVLCSQNAAQSKYVNFEVDWFIRNKGIDKVLLAVTQGNDPSNQEFLYPKHVVENKLHKRIFYDLRGFKKEAKGWLKVRDKDEELMKLAAHLNGQAPGDILPIWQQEEIYKLKRQRYIRSIAATIFLGLTIIALLLWLRADRNEREARNQLAKNYWSSAKAALNKGSTLEFLHLVGHAISNSEDDSLKNLFFDAQPSLPFYKLEKNFHSKISGAVFSQELRRILSWGNDGTIGLWDVLSGDSLAVLKHGGSVSEAFFNKDESHILSWGDGIKVWETSNGRQITEIKLKNNISGAVLSHDGSFILAWEEDGTIRLWNANNGEPLAAMKHEGGIRGATFYHEGQRILSWGFDGNIRSWEAATGDSIIVIPHGADVGGAIFSQDESRILSWSRVDGTIRLWEATSGKLLAGMQHGGYVYGASFSQDERRILAWGDGVRLWPVSINQQLDSSIEPIAGPMRHKAAVLGAVFSQDERHILSWSNDGVRFWQVETGQPLAVPLQHKGAVIGAIFNRNQSQILSWEEDGTTQLWQVAANQPMALLMRHKGSVEGAVFDQDEQRILSRGGGDDGTIRLWHAFTGHPLAVMEHGEAVEGDVYNELGATFSHKEHRILSWGRDRSVRLWDASTGNLEAVMKHEGGINGAVLTQDDHRVLSYGYDGTARMWSAFDGRSLALMKHGEDMEGDDFNNVSASFSRDERRILSWGDDGTVRIWNADNGKLLKVMQNKVAVLGAVFSRDERHILSWGDDGTIRVWDAINGIPLEIIQHEGYVRGAIFSRDERRILSWGGDAIRLWQTFYGKLLAEMKPEGGTDGGIEKAVFSRDERLILSWGDGIIRLWPTGGSLPLSEMRGRSIRGASFSSDESRILSWSLHGIWLWQTITGWPLAESIQFQTNVLGATFNHDESRILSWGNDGTIQLMDIQADLDFPKDLFITQVQAITGTALNLKSLTVYFLPIKEWENAKEKYNKIARDHYKVCKYPRANLWNRFHSIEANIVSSSQ